MTTIWVTGSKGQLGTEFSLQQNSMPGFNFVNTDIQELDLRDEKAVRSFLEANKPSYIINCAAYTAVDKAETDQKTAYEINRDVPAILVRLADPTITRIIHVSTDYVFDGLANRPYTEKDLTNPQSVYGRSKLDGELEILKGEKNLVIRTSWLYSAYGNNFVKTMLRLGAEKEEIGVVYDQVGSPTWANDFAGAILTIIRELCNSEKKWGGIYHYANEGVCSWFDFASVIMKSAGLACRVNPITSAQYPQVAKRPPYSVFDTGKLKETFGITIPSWSTSIEKCLKQLTGK
jgi:dTDP-4-dehydrorhamnose reductase